ncbi:hypothetical protein IPN35_05850 [Candidatus Peregrinibacteria bacterium]|nr:MAG: hypothetical protein IPN35_05850 [Candidatus Peregrinibacteria bacterium]
MKKYTSSLRILSLFDAFCMLVVLGTMAFALLLGNVAPAAHAEFLPSAHAAPELIITNNDKTNFTPEESDPREVILRVVNYFLGFVGLIAVIFVIFAGFLMLTAGGDEDQVGRGKTILIWAAIGIIVVLLSWALVKFVADIFQ